MVAAIGPLGAGKPGASVLGRARLDRSESAGWLM
jgi:hypothetical protein